MAGEPATNRECLWARWPCHGTERRCQRARRDRTSGWGDECRRAGSGWVSGRLGAFDDSPTKRVVRSSDLLAEGTQRTCAVWTATRKPGDSRLGHALQRLDDDRSGRKSAVSPRTEPTTSETSAKNLNPFGHQKKRLSADCSDELRWRLSRALRIGSR